MNSQPQYQWVAVGLLPSGLFLTKAGYARTDDPHAMASDVDCYLRVLHPEVRWCDPQGKPEEEGIRWCPVFMYHGE